MCEYMRTLFIGNSHTYFNDMPKMFMDICRDNGIDMQVTMLTKGGEGLDYHADNQQTRFNILYGNYDYIILQHVAHPMGEMSVLEEAADKIMTWVRRSKSKACFFMTWTEKENESFQSEMARRYRYLADKHQCLLAPVGEKWWEYIHEHPEDELYADDGRHASEKGSRLAAQTIFESLGIQKK
ncbi:MAG: hypothetical protein K6E18_00850 [Lachnospiraceae bacterium]|nr:hypothetical protein [Lachnospiraceae bacterium]